MLSSSSPPISARMARSSARATANPRITAGFTSSLRTSEPELSTQVHPRGSWPRIRATRGWDGEENVTEEASDAWENFVGDPEVRGPPPSGRSVSACGKREKQESANNLPEPKRKTSMRKRNRREGFRVAGVYAFIFENAHIRSLSPIFCTSSAGMRNGKGIRLSRMESDRLFNRKWPT